MSAEMETNSLIESIEGLATAFGMGIGLAISGTITFFKLLSWFKPTKSEQSSETHKPKGYTNYEIDILRKEINLEIKNQLLDFKREMSILIKEEIEFNNRSKVYDMNIDATKFNSLIEQRVQSRLDNILGHDEK